jgi:NADPH:quinone reductase-like Zn-dependent oxidoreductase
MKAVVFARNGEPKEVLEVTGKPIPEPGGGQVRVRMLLSPVNPSDLLYVRGKYSGVTPAFPAPVGFEGVGVIDALGPGVQRLEVGQRVIARNGHGGNWADYAVIPASSAHPALAQRQGSSRQVCNRDGLSAARAIRPGTCGAGRRARFGSQT